MEPYLFWKEETKPVARLRRHPLIISIFPGWLFNPGTSTSYPAIDGASRYFFIFKFLLGNAIKHLDGCQVKVEKCNQTAMLCS